VCEDAITIRVRTYKNTPSAELSTDEPIANDFGLALGLYDS
jgi:hypothetical protein